MDAEHNGQGGNRPAPGPLHRVADRRTFLQWSGAAAATALVVACDDAPTESTSTPNLETAAATSAGAVTINLSNDFGILNFAYALEQLEAAFYTKVVDDFYGGATDEERAILVDIRKHEVAHRDFFRTALGSAAIPGLEVDFSRVDFASRESVLVTAKVLEDTGVGAYNGAAQFLRSDDYLVVAGKIVSVEARHAAAIRSVLGRSFAPRVFDPASTFEEVLKRANPFIVTEIKLTRSPTAGLVAQSSSLEEEMAS